jgi:hypothetical protein
MTHGLKCGSIKFVYFERMYHAAIQSGGISGRHVELVVAGRSESRSCQIQRVSQQKRGGGLAGGYDGKRYAPNDVFLDKGSLCGNPGKGNDVRKLKILSYAIPLLTLVVWGVLALLQIWTSIMSSDTFKELTLSAAIVIAISVIVVVAVHGYIENAELKKQNYLDE